MLIYLLLLALQITVLVAIAGCLHRMFRRRPSVQYFVWLATIISVGIPIPLQSQVPSLEMEVPVAASEPPVAKSMAPLVESGGLEAPSVLVQSKAPAGNTVLAPGKSTRSLERSSSVSSGIDFTRITFWQWLAIAWGTVVFALVLRLLGGIRALHRLARSAKKTLQSNQMVDAIAQQVCPRRKVQVLVSDQARVPMAFGIVRPTILLPESFLTWSQEAQEAVLLHEFSHIQRFDALWDLVSRLISIAYWFHPAVHFATWRLRQTRERATDRQVLAHGVSPTVYATQLLDVATNASRSQRPAMYMSCQGDIRNRIDTILSCVAVPEKKSWKLKLALLAGFLVLASVSVSVSFATIAPQDETDTVAAKKEPTKPEDVTGKTFFERVQQVDPNELKSDGKPISISGHITDKQGNPVPDAIVVFRNASAMSSSGSGAINDVMAKTTSHANGSYSFENLTNPIHPSGGAYCQLFCVSKKQVGLSHFQLYADSTGSFDKVDIVLVDTVSVKGKVVDEQGSPVPNTRVKLSYVSELVEGKEHQSHFADRMINPQSTTDAEGRFELPGMPSGVAIGLDFDHPDFAIGYECMRSTKDHSKFIVNYDNSRSEIADNGATIQLEAGIELSGIVTDEKGVPVKGAKVCTIKRNASTDAAGRFSIRQNELEDDPKLDLFVGKEFHRIFQVEQSKLIDGTARLKLIPPGTIKGKVVSAHNGKPIEGLRIQFDADRDGATHIGVTRIADTDADGAFEVAVESGLVKILFRRSNNSPDLVIEKATGEGWNKPVVGEFHQVGDFPYGSVNVKPGETKEITIRIPVRGLTYAKVLDLEGNPVEGALVGFRSTAGGTVGFSKTDANGMAGVKPPMQLRGTRQLVARFESKGKILFAESGLINELGSAVVEMKLRPSITLSGTVSVQSQPLESAAVFIRRPNGSSPAFEVASAVTDEHGKYSVQVPRGAVERQIPNYRIGVASDKIPNQKISFFPHKAVLVGDQFIADVDLIRGKGKIAGVVVDSAGEPVANSFVEVQHLMMRHPERKEIQPSQLFESTSQYTDAEGRFEIGGIPEGFQAIVVAGSRSTMQGASLVSVGNLSAKVLVTDIGEESQEAINLR